MRISRPCPRAPPAPPGWKCLILASRSGFGALRRELRTAWVRAGVSLPTACLACPEPDPERRDGWGSARPARPLGALPAEFGVATGRVVCQVGRGGQQGSSPSIPFLPKAAERRRWAATISQGGEGDDNPVARTSLNSREAQKSLRMGLAFPKCGMWHSSLKTCSDRPSPVPASFVPPDVWGVCLGSGIGKFQHLCLSAVWFLEGNRYFGSVFTSDHLLHSGQAQRGWPWRMAVE